MILKQFYWPLKYKRLKRLTKNFPCRPIAWFPMFGARCTFSHAFRTHGYQLLLAVLAGSCDLVASLYTICKVGSRITSG